MQSRQMLKGAFYLLAMVLVALAPRNASAQAVSARLEGVVSDATQAVIPNAKVVATNKATGLEYDTATNESGRFVFVQLPPGTYTLSATTTGFKRFIQDGVLLQVGAAVTINITLEQGDVTKSVTVEGQTPLLDQTTTKIGTVVENRQAVDLPLNGRGAIHQSRRRRSGRFAEAFVSRPEFLKH